MPIRPENRARYPKDWKAISLRIRLVRANGRCECSGECGLDHSANYQGRCGACHQARHPSTGSLVVLTVAHLDHTPENCADDNLKAMCQQCHNRYDGPMRRAGIAKRKREALEMADLFDAQP
jgi:5-methylcytosine-specific restriction endonuclease McrA